MNADAWRVEMKGPTYVDWAITSACNLNCRHCVGMNKDELNHREAARAAENIVGLSPRWVILEGGEPVLRDDLSVISYTIITSAR
ncbi:hypothetical protein AKJ37_04680 [candidate division MSBL1 archaeon SCGC-AAA259I09]|uniref:Radical SAM core domain-containing protein n=1 Tax=candidate division MSBL1 archaeon SCGC-AAA259I09 TaxID=1698267 RepID=A0A133UR53_9EURY|nr:hypothetical protein AKJ37_04680 [candidate division MSBL1 archaeon SCGC-AAA259I09]